MLIENRLRNSKCPPLEVFNSMQKEAIEYVYIGEFTTTITDSILSLAELNLETSNDSVKLKKRVYFILVEGLQNITRHQQYEPEYAQYSGLLVIQRIDDGFVITTANYIKNSEVERLRQHLDNINRLKREELKDYYRKILSEQRFTKKGGAGLGLIEIARKSGHKLVYSFDKFDNKYSIFYLQTRISIPSQPIDSQKALQSLERIKTLHRFFLTCNIVLSFAGILMQDKLVFMLSILEKRINKEVILKSKVFSVIVELLQNVANHSDVYELDNISGHYAIFYIAEDQKYLRVTTGNYIKKEKIQRLKQKLDYVNSLSIKELTKLHYQILKNYKDQKKDETQGLGLFNIRLKSKKKLNYYFQEVDEQFAFFSIEVILEKMTPEIESLKIKPTKTVPHIFLSAKEAKFIFEGYSIDPQINKIYERVLEWFDYYLNYPRNFTILQFKFKDFNKLTEDYILKLLKKLDYTELETVVIAKWFIYPGIEQKSLDFYNRISNQFDNIDFQQINWDGE